MNFVHFSCVIFFAQDVPIPINCILLLGDLEIWRKYKKEELFIEGYGFKPSAHFLLPFICTGLIKSGK